jgi:hypothetical protein
VPFRFIPPRQDSFSQSCSAMAKCGKVKKFDCIF